MLPRLVTGAIAALALLLAGLLGVTAYRNVGQPAPEETGIGGDFTLIDGDGRTVSDGDFRGRWMLVYFGYTNCPDSCPTALNDIAVALHKLGKDSDRVAPIFVTIDPERDTVPVVKQYAAAFGPSFIGLTGTPDEIRRIEHAYKVYAAKQPALNGDYAMGHSSYIYVMGPDGRFIRTFTQEDDPDAMARELARLIG